MLLGDQVRKGRAVSEGASGYRCGGGQILGKRMRDDEVVVGSTSVRERVFDRAEGEVADQQLADPIGTPLSYLPAASVDSGPLTCLSPGGTHSSQSNITDQSQGGVSERSKLDHAHQTRNIESQYPKVEGHIGNFPEAYPNSPAPVPTDSRAVRAPQTQADRSNVVVPFQPASDAAVNILIDYNFLAFRSWVLEEHSRAKESENKIDRLLFEFLDAWTEKHACVTVFDAVKLLKAVDVWLRRCLSRKPPRSLYPRSEVVRSVKAKKTVPISKVGRSTRTASGLELDLNGTKHWLVGQDLDNLAFWLKVANPDAVKALLRGLSTWKNNLETQVSDRTTFLASCRTVEQQTFEHQKWYNDLVRGNMRTTERIAKLSNAMMEAETHLRAHGITQSLQAGSDQPHRLDLPQVTATGSIEAVNHIASKRHGKIEKPYFKDTKPYVPPKSQPSVLYDTALSNCAAQTVQRRSANDARNIVTSAVAIHSLSRTEHVDIREAALRLRSQRIQRAKLISAQASHQINVERSANKLSDYLKFSKKLSVATARISRADSSIQKLENQPGVLAAETCEIPFDIVLILEQIAATKKSRDALMRDVATLRTEELRNLQQDKINNCNSSINGFFRKIQRHTKNDPTWWPRYEQVKLEYLGDTQMMPDESPLRETISSMSVDDPVATVIDHKDSNFKNVQNPNSGRDLISTTAVGHLINQPAGHLIYTHDDADSGKGRVTTFAPVSGANATALQPCRVRFDSQAIELHIGKNALGGLRSMSNLGLSSNTASSADNGMMPSNSMLIPTRATQHMETQVQTQHSADTLIANVAPTRNDTVQVEFRDMNATMARSLIGACPRERVLEAMERNLAALGRRIGEKEL